MNASSLDKDVVAANLKLAMEDNSITVRALSERIRESMGRHATGTSPATLQMYKSGSVRWPRVPVLEEAARVLGRRPEWLIWNEGAPTLVEEHARQTAALARAAIEQKAEKESLHLMREALFEEIPRFRDEVRISTLNQIWELACAWITDGNLLIRYPQLTKSLAETVGPAGTPVIMHPELVVAAVREVATILRAPAKMAGIDLATLSNSHLDLYVATMSPAIRLLITQPRVLASRAWAKAPPASSQSPED